MNDYQKEILIKLIEEQNLGVFYTNNTFSMITTLKVGGKINILFYPNSIESLIIIIDKCHKDKINYFIIGNGSNILASDDFYDGLVISLKQIPNKFIIEKINDKRYSVIVDGGCSTKKFSDFLIDHHLTGAEGLGFIPATVGGVVAMNASCYSFEASKFVKRVEVISDGKLVWLENKELEYSYRNSKILKDKLIATRVEFEFEKGIIDEILNKNRNFYEQRKITQPIDKKCAGSTFKNGNTYKAWKLIDNVGLKGFKIGGAIVSKKHANFLINDGNAKSIDFYNLIKYIKRTVKNELNIELETEWIFINFN